MKQQESFWKEQIEKEKENWKSASEGVEQAQAQFAFQRETFQKTLRNLKVKKHIPPGANPLKQFKPLAGVK